MCACVRACVRVCECVCVCEYLRGWGWGAACNKSQGGLGDGGGREVGVGGWGGRRTSRRALICIVICNTVLYW